jgi:hypothetical protein
MTMQNLMLDFGVCSILVEFCGNAVLVPWTTPWQVFFRQFEINLSYDNASASNNFIQCELNFADDRFV